jgi:hypothetical protein
MGFVPFIKKGVTGDLLLFLLLLQAKANPPQML